MHAFCSYFSMTRVLMIDDDNDLLMVTKKLLKNKGFQIETYTGWTDAKDRIRSFDPNLVVLDVFLQNDDGLEICKKLRASPFTRHIPILIVSGFPKIAESAIFEFGADDFMAKPFKGNEMIAKMRRILGRNEFSA